MVLCAGSPATHAITRTVSALILQSKSDYSIRMFCQQCRVVNYNRTQMISSVHYYYFISQFNI